MDIFRSDYHMSLLFANIDTKVRMSELWFEFFNLEILTEIVINLKFITLYLMNLHAEIIYEETGHEQTGLLNKNFASFRKFFLHDLNEE